MQSRCNFATGSSCLCQGLVLSLAVAFLIMPFAAAHDQDQGRQLDRQGAKLYMPGPGQGDYRRGRRQDHPPWPGFDQSQPGSTLPDSFGATGKGPSGQQASTARGRFRNRQVFGSPLDLSALGLSDEQKQRIRQKRARSSAKARSIRQDLRQRRAEMRDLMFSPEASEKQIEAKHHEIRQVQGELEDLIISDFLSVRSVLTPEQRLRLPEIKPSRSRQPLEPRLP